MAKYIVDMGHTLSGAGTGANGYVRETDKNREVGKRLIAMLTEKGHTVINATVDSSSNDLAARTAIANKHKDATLFISLHLNAYKMLTSEMGVETFIWNGSWSGKSELRKKAQLIQNALVADVKWKDRGVKEDNFHVLRETLMPAILVELGFCDSKGDMDKWNTETIARALFRGVVGTSYVPNNSTPSTGGSFKVGDKVVVSKSATVYATGQTMASWVKGSTYTITELKSDRALLSDIVSWVYLKDLSKSGSTATPGFTAYKVKINADVLNVRDGAGTGYKVNTTVKQGEVYTIVGEKSGWGQLKSGAGWISLEYTVKV